MSNSINSITNDCIKNGTRAFITVAKEGVFFGMSEFEPFRRVFESAGTARSVIMTGGFLVSKIKKEDIQLTLSLIKQEVKDSFRVEESIVKEIRKGKQASEFSDKPRIKSMTF